MADASTQGAVVLGGAAVLCVAVAALVLLLPRLGAWAARLYWSLLPPSWAPTEGDQSASGGR
jgi:hypothetical protein